MKKQCSTCAKRFTCPFFQKGLEEWVCLSYEEDEVIQEKEKEDERSNKQTGGYRNNCKKEQRLEHNNKCKRR